MIDIPIGKALVAVETDRPCKNCFFEKRPLCALGHLSCAAYQRKDGKRVIFKLVDWPAKEKK